MKLKRKPEIREALKNDLADIIKYMEIGRFYDTPESTAERIIYLLEKLGWHGVKDE